MVQINLLTIKMLPIFAPAFWNNTDSQNSPRILKIFVSK